MWRAVGMATALVVATAAQGLAAESQTVLGFARTFSLMSEVAAVCPGVIATDAGYARRFAAAARDAATTSFGARAWSEVVPRELSRRRKEVRITGAGIWCENQRRYLREYGDTQTFP